MIVVCEVRNHLDVMMYIAVRMHSNTGAGKTEYRVHKQHQLDKVAQNQTVLRDVNLMHRLQLLYQKQTQK